MIFTSLLYYTPDFFWWSCVELKYFILFLLNLKSLSFQWVANEGNRQNLFHSKFIFLIDLIKSNLCYPINCETISHHSQLYFRLFYGSCGIKVSGVELRWLCTASGNGHGHIARVSTAEMFGGFPRSIECFTLGLHGCKKNGASGESSGFRNSKTGSWKCFES